MSRSYDRVVAQLIQAVNRRESSCKSATPWSTEKILARLNGRRLSTQTGVIYASNKVEPMVERLAESARYHLQDRVLLLMSRLLSFIRSVPKTASPLVAGAGSVLGLD